MKTKEFLPEEVAGKLRNLRLLIVQRFDSQANFALVIGEQEAFVSRVLNGRRYLKPAEKELWAQVLKTDLSVFPDPPSFRRNDDVCPNYSPGGTG
jgi:hypothetical protein